MRPLFPFPAGKDDDERVVKPTTVCVFGLCHGGEPKTCYSDRKPVGQNQSSYVDTPRMSSPILSVPYQTAGVSKITKMNLRR